MADKKPSVKFITPRGVAVFPKLTKPDTKFKAEGEYRVKLLVTAGSIPEDVIAKLTKLRDDFVEETKAALTQKKEGAKVKKLKVLDLFKDEVNKETGEPTGKTIISAKMTASGISKKDKTPWTRAPKLFDAAGKKLPAKSVIWGGSELKVAVQAMPYYMPKDNEVGVALYLEAVQVLKLVSSGGESADDYGFGAEEGYTAEPEETFPTDDSADAPASTASAGDDF